MYNTKHVRHSPEFVWRETGFEYEKCIETYGGESWAKCKSKDFDSILAIFLTWEPLSVLTSSSV